MSGQAQVRTRYQRRCKLIQKKQRLNPKSKIWETVGRSEDDMIQSCMRNWRRRRAAPRLKLPLLVFLKRQGSITREGKGQRQEVWRMTTHNSRKPAKLYRKRQTQNDDTRVVNFTLPTILDITLFPLTRIQQHAGDTSVQEEFFPSCVYPYEHP